MFDNNQQTLIGNVLASYEIDIDGDIIKEKIIEKDKDMLSMVGLDVNCSYSRFLKLWAEKNVYSDDRAVFLREMNPGFLRGQYADGYKEVTCEYRSINAEGKMIWCCTTIYLVMAGKHLFGHVYVKDINERKHKELELLRQSKIDPLTGLLNRASCLQEINWLLMSDTRNSGALLMIDVDDFKLVNDTFGHMYGDKVLANIAYKLKNIFDKDTVIGRLGGDEFVAFMPNTHDSAVFEKARIIAKELQTAHREGGACLKISNSIGIAFCPRHGNKFHELYVKADTALRYAKQSGKSCYSVFGDNTKEVVPVQYVNREWLIDELEDIIYISDIEDYTLLYVNRAGRDLTGIKIEDFEKCKCYRLLQGRDMPCPFCTNAKLEKQVFYVWEYENPYLNKNFIVKDKLVEWNGKPVRMEVALDVSGRPREDSNITSTKYYMENVMLESLRALNTAETLDEAIRRTLKIIAEFYGGERVYIMEIDREHGIARNTYEWCRADVMSQKQSLQNVPLDAIPYIFETFNKKQHLIIPKVEELKSSYPSEYRFLISRQAEALFAVPFDDTTDFNGYIGVDNPNINQDTIKLLDTIAYNIANEIKKRRLYEKMEYDAGHDALSGLRNRSSFIRYQGELQKGAGQTCGVVIADINGLKRLNREYGHGKGDETICIAAGIMTAAFLQDCIFRISGDEFVMIDTDSGYEEFMTRVRKMNLEMGEKTPYGVSLGCTWTENVSDFESLLHHAQELMLVNKQIYYRNSNDAGKHYSPEAAKKLYREIEQGYYKVYLQPKVSVADGRVKGAEALARYQAPGGKLMPPGKFVPPMEREKLIRYLDFYIFNEVCRLIEGWKKEGRTLIPVSVNFSRITLLENDLIQALNSIKSKYDIPYNLIVIEITESIGHIEHKIIAAVGARLREAGFRLSLDDFGADYANMSILSIIHFDEVKLDKSLIDNLAENEMKQTVVKGIIEICRNLKLECVAEGVETKEQLELLKEFGCTTVQGYYYGKPVEKSMF